MKVTDYLVEYLISKGVDCIFGYPGGVICHFMDSIQKYSPAIKGFICYHEQAASFSACGYAQVSLKPGVAFATSGPGATNLITGISNAFFDSIPTIFITGQVDTYALKGEMKIRQKGFQETDIVSMVKSVTKYAVQINSADQVQESVEKAYKYAVSGRPGPVLLDIPADIQRADITIKSKIDLKVDQIDTLIDLENDIQLILEKIKVAKRPCFILGTGIKQSGLVSSVKKLLDIIHVPVVTSMPAFDILPTTHPLNFGFMGANGHRYANFIVSKSDLLLTLGSRLDLKQVGNIREKFAPSAKLIRIDIDAGELEYKLHKDEIQINADAKDVITKLLQVNGLKTFIYPEWLDICKEIKDKLKDIDLKIYHKLITSLSKKISDNIIVTVDVGQHQPWVAQAFLVKHHQRFCFSGGLGSMGYSLPAAIGAHFGSGLPVVSINGDGGVQMNIQELQFIVREKLPILVVVLNNHSLGMIRQFQEMNFKGNYISTTEDSGYLSPDFGKIARAYGFTYMKVDKIEEMNTLDITFENPTFLEMDICMNTFLEPRFSSNRPFQDQEPLIDRSLFNYLMSL